MEIFKNPNYEFLNWKWPLIGLSLVFSISGLISLIRNDGPRYGIDFRGGTVVYAKFKDTPPIDRLRKALADKCLGESPIQRFGAESNNEVIINVEQNGRESVAIDTSHVTILQ